MDTEQRTVLVGDAWAVAFAYPLDPAPAVTVIPPTGVTTTVVPAGTVVAGWAAAIPITLPGRWVALVGDTLTGIDAFSVWAEDPARIDRFPDITDLRGQDENRANPDDLGYLGANSWPDSEILDALEAEAAAQRSTCRIPAVYPADLRQALLRRVKRNLAMRGLALAVLRGDAEAGGADTVLPGRDPEVRRLEAPFRKLPIG